MPGRSSPEPAAWTASAAEPRRPTDLARRFVTLLAEKAVLQVATAAVFWLGYWWLSRHAPVPSRPPPLTWLDRAVEFTPEPWAWVYLSQFLLVSALPWLIDARPLLHRYILAMLLMSLASFSIFYVHPVASPRPAVLPATGPMAWIVQLDGPYNAFPSLHAGFALLMVYLAWRMFRRPAVSGVVVVWTLLILYSTLATRQHYAWDLVAGAVVGAAADWLAGVTLDRVTLPEKPGRAAG
jgi:membrane-associated phospholipid phosphatase